MPIGSSLPPSSDSLPAVPGCVVTVSITKDLCTNTINLILGANQATPWLESAIIGLRAGATVKIQDPNSAIVLLKLHNVSLPNDGMAVAPTREEYLKRAEELRMEANESFKKSEGSFKEVKKATLGYNRALDMIRKGGGDIDMVAKTRNNLALCHFRMGDWIGCVAMCDAALAENPECAKAYYRRGLAMIELDWIVRGLSDLREARRLAPGDTAIKKEYERIEAESKRVLCKRRDQFAETYSFKPQSSLFSEPIPN